MSSGISKDKKIISFQESSDKLEIIEQIDLSKACVPFSIFFEEMTLEKTCVSIKDIPFTKLDPEFRRILKKEFLE